MFSARGRLLSNRVLVGHRLHPNRSFGVAIRTIKSGAASSFAPSFVVFAAGIASLAVSTTYADKTLLAAGRPASGDLVELSSGTPVKEPATGILFPQLCNGMYFTGCGVRVKFGFVKVYAVGTYMDPLSLSAVKTSSKEAIEQALLDPTYPRTIRIVMNRAVSVEKFTSAIVEALQPRMMGQELETLDEFRKLNPPVDLVQGAEIEMTIRGDTLLYKNAVGGVGTIRSAVFTKAMCDVYYGADPVSAPHKAAVVEGIRKL